MRKIPPEMENPIDNIIISLADNTDGIYKKFNMTANDITSLSLFFGILCAYYIYKGNNTLAVITFILSHYYDCMDGNYARKYNQVSNFGDYYDHISDLFKLVLIGFALYKRNPTKFKYVLIILIPFYLLTVAHLGCQERMSGFNDNHMLDNLEILCPNDDLIYYSRYFGCGTFMFVTAIIIYTY